MDCGNFHLRNDRQHKLRGVKSIAAGEPLVCKMLCICKSIVKTYRELPASHNVASNLISDDVSNLHIL